MADPWWVIHAGGTALADSTFQGTKTQAVAAAGGGSGQGVIAGPYGTQALAQAWINSNQGKNGKLPTSPAGNYFTFKGYYGDRALILNSKVDHFNARLFGFHGYQTAVESEGHPNSVQKWNLLEVAQVNGWVKNAGSPGTGNVGGIGAATAPITNPAGTLGIPSVANPLSGIDGLVSEVGAIGGAVLDGKMWRSVAWLILGVILLALGLVVVMREEIMPTVGRVTG